MLDYSQNFARPRLTTVRGTAIPYSYGGKIRQIQIDLDPQAMQARGLSATDVQNAFVNQNQIVPAGQAKIGTFQYNIALNDAADTIVDMNNLPVKTVNGSTSSCMMSPMCATAVRRSRISCMSMAAAPSFPLSSRPARPRPWMWCRASRTSSPPSRRSCHPPSTSTC